MYKQSISFHQGKTLRTLTDWKRMKEAYHLRLEQGRNTSADIGQVCVGITLVCHSASIFSFELFLTFALPIHKKKVPMPLLALAQNYQLYFLFDSAWCHVFSEVYLLLELCEQGRAATSRVLTVRETVHVWAATRCHGSHWLTLPKRYQIFKYRKKCCTWTTHVQSGECGMPGCSELRGSQDRLLGCAMRASGCFWEIPGRSRVGHWWTLLVDAKHKTFCPLAPAFQLWSRSP